MKHLALAAALMAGPVVAAEITPAGLDTLPPAQVVILGEVHDNPAHHVNQARAVSALAPAALVFEMLTPDQAALITPELRGDAAALGAVLDWAHSGWPDFAMYHAIMTATDAAIYGGALPSDEVRRAVGEGAAAVFGPDAATYGLDLPLPDAMQSAREELQHRAHCQALPSHLLSGMVEAQRLRDAAMARAVMAAHKDLGGPVAVITGNGHARTDWGLPAALRTAAPTLSVLSIAQFEVSAEAATPYDLWLITEAVERDDPCAVFSKD